MSRLRICAAAIAFGCALPYTVQADRSPATDIVTAALQMMTDMAPQSAQASMAIREAYQPFFDPLVLTGYQQVRDALANGGLVHVPGDPRLFNIAPRLDGTNPIGEKDLLNQASYVSGRPAMIGCLIELASRVKSGPIEVTSLVRHGEYQDALRATNWNATTDLPTHTMGIAFDIAVLNTPVETVYEIRDVLRRMSEAGDIIFIGERHQLVFHVVPHPSRLGHFNEVYARAARDGASFEMPLDWSYAVTPMVRADVASLRPTTAFEDAWWAADNVPVDVVVEVTSGAAPLAAHVTPSLPVPPAGTRGYLEILAEFLVNTINWATSAVGIPDRT